MLFIGNGISGFNDISNFRRNDNSINALALLKVLSYFTGLILLSFAVLYGVTSLYGRVRKKQNLLPLDQNVMELAKGRSVRHNVQVNATEIAKTRIISNNQNAEITQPDIISDDWGKISLKVNGLIETFRDVIILPSSDKQVAKEWNWKWDREGMHHHPGIRPKDIEHLILSHNPKPDVIILSQGRGHGGLRNNPGPGILEVDPNLRDYIISQGINEIYIHKTLAAIEKYNEIRNQGNKRRIAALIHTTC